MSLLEVFGIAFESDADDLEKGAKKAEKSVDDLESSVSATDETVEGLGESFLSFATSAQGALAGVLSLSAITAGVISQALRTDEIGKFSDALGLNVEEVGAWSEAVVRMGGDASSFQSTLGSLTDRLTDFALTGGGEAAEVFARLGINARDAQGNVKSAFDVLPEIANAFERLDRRESLAFGRKLGLDQGTILLLQQGKVAVDELVDRQKQLGVATAKDAEIAAKFNDQWADTKQVFQSLAIATGASLLPVFTQLLSGVESFVFFLAEHEDLVVGFFVGVSAVLTYLYLPAILSVAAATIAAVAPFIAIGAAVVAVGAAFALVYEDIRAFMRGEESLIGNLAKEFEIVQKAIDVITGQVKALVNAGRAVGGFISDLFGGDDDELAIKATRAIEQANNNPLASTNSAALARGANVTRSNSVSISNLNVDARGGDSAEIAANASGALSSEMERVVSNFDDGVEY